MQIDLERALAKHWIEARLAQIKRRKAELADVLGVNRSRISEMLRGRRQIPIRELPALSRFLELPVGEILRLETGDPGYREVEPGVGSGSIDLEEGALEVYGAAKDTLGAFTRHGLDDMTDSEIDIYAKVIARCATRAPSERDDFTLYRMAPKAGET